MLLKSFRPTAVLFSSNTRHFPYAVSFGPEHEDMVLPEFGGPMHGANEAAPIDKLLEALKIYIIALLRLEEIDF